MYYAYRAIIQRSHLKKDSRFRVKFVHMQYLCVQGKSLSEMDADVANSVLQLLQNAKVKSNYWPETICIKVYL